uniref:Secreted protein n=1 Tax=Mus spicilegus TaxID=10103 RepID=A0A8C6HF21_MUSSI
MDNFLFFLLFFLLRIAGSSGSTMSNFLRNRQTDFQNGCTSLQSHQQWRSVPLSPHPCQHLLSPEFLILAILTGVRWNLRVISFTICLENCFPAFYSEVVSVFFPEMGFL